MSRANRLVPVLFLAVSLAPPTRAADVVTKLGAGDGFVIQDNTGAIQRLKVDEANGNLSRNGALFVHTTGTENLFVGPDAGDLASAGMRNAGVGLGALTSPNLTGSYNSAFGQLALSANTAGSRNSAFGHGALNDNTTGVFNSAFGDLALQFNQTMGGNSAFGTSALRGSGPGTSTGYRNSAFGVSALLSNTTGYRNAAFGTYTLAYNTTGNKNSALGDFALNANTTGSRNVAVGVNAGSAQTTGSDNIYIANVGFAGESATIRIGTTPTHTSTRIAGIFGTTAPAGIAVFVSPQGVLGTVSSSARFKQDVRDMGEASDVLLRLRPVVFRYREEVAKGGDLQYGLIAEEVAEVAPELVAPDLEGRPYSVRYHELPALLLNELQEQQRTIDALLARVSELEQRPGGKPSGEVEQ